MAITANQLEDLIRRLTPPEKIKHFTQCTARFNGTRTSEAVEDFLAAADFYKTSESIGDENALKGISLLLQEEAHTWWMGVKDSISTWDQAQAAIRNEFAPRPPAYRIYQELFATKQSATTPTGLFVSQKRALLAQVQPPDSEERQLDFIYGLLYVNIRNRVPRNSVTTFPALLKAAREAEEVSREKENIEGRPTATTAKPKRTQCSYCRNMGHESTVCRKKARDEANQRPNKNRQSDTHRTTEQTPRQDGRQAIERRTPNRENGITCYGCGTPGVMRRNCRTCTPDPQHRDPPRISFNALHLEDDERPIVTITIAGSTGTAFLDSGAKTSLASPALQTILEQKDFPYTEKRVQLIMANGNTQVQMVKIITVPVELNGRMVNTPFVCAKGGPEAVTLLGIDFARKAELVVNYKLGLYHFHGHRHECYQFMNKVTINPFQAAQEKTHTPEPDPSDAALLSEYDELMMTDEWADLTRDYGPLLSPLPPTPPRHKARPEPTSLQVPQGPSIDTASRTEYMWKDAEFATRELYNDLDTGTAPSHLWLFTLDLRPEDEGHAFTDTERQEIGTLLQEHTDLFRQHGPATPYAEHRIDTGSHPPIASPPYRLSPRRQEVLRKEVEALLAMGIIEECESPWASPAVLVPKPDGSMRLCIDYRKLNTATRPDVYPLPRLDDLLHSTGAANFLSTIDLKAGYYQIQVAQQDRDKTAFITPFGVYRFTRLPFGLRNAPATFQRLIDRLRTKLPHMVLLAYLDDLIILSPTAAKHLEDLQDVFSQLRVFQLRMNRAKCRFACREVKYLGHLVSAQGIRTDPEKVTAILNLPPPSQLKHIQSFLQTCSWYRRFIPNFAEISRPLSRLTKKNVLFTWGPAETEAYQNLKKALTTAPVLRQADQTQGYVLRTDASNSALGAALLQGEGWDERPIEYASRLLTTSECNYSTTEREALAIVWACQKFRAYLEGSPTIVITDHQPLRWLMSLKSPSGRLARWALQLQPYNLTIEYTPGKANVVADTLSRPPRSSEQPIACPAATISVDLPTRTPGDLRSGQMADPDLEKIIKCLEGGTLEEATPWTTRGYLLNQGVLYRYPQEDDMEETQLVVPVQETESILKAYHDSPTAGHYGVSHTLQKIRRHYYWVGMKSTVAQYIKTCIQCQRYKLSNLKPAGLLQTPAPQQRYEVLAIDLFGPLPEATTGERWILVVEDYATKWIELLPLKQASASTCAEVLINEIFLRYGLPRRLISDNGTQFVSAVMQQITHCFDIDHRFTPVYHPSSNPVERKNRDLKTQLSIMLGNDHTAWPEKIPSVCFAMNSIPCQSTGYSAAYLHFGRELRGPTDVRTDLRPIIMNENFLAEITPQLLKMTDTLVQARDTLEKQQDNRKAYADAKRRKSENFQPGDKVWVTTQPISRTSRGFTSKFAPRRDGPYIILAARGPCSYEVASPANPSRPLGVYHTSALQYVHEPEEANSTEPLIPLRPRGRPRKTITEPHSTTNQNPCRGDTRVLRGRL